jgi:hypothetical protein
LTEPEVQDPSQELLGWPGYRTQPGHSGLDPIESTSELGHVLGICLRDLLLFRARTRNPLAWLGMFVVGLLFLAPLAAAILYLPGLGEAAFPLLMVSFFPAFLGILIWTNLALNLGDWTSRK